jgi:hypothetical protein
MHRLLLSIALLAALAPAASASSVEPDGAEPAANYVGASVVGFAGFLRLNVGSYVVWYERALTPRHGLRLGGDFIHVHQAADHTQSHQWTYGGSIGYRYHWRPAEGPFVGVEVGYRQGVGHYGLADAAEHTMLENRQLRILPELGMRFVHDRLPLALVTRIAVGYGPYEVTTDRDDDVGAAAARFSRDVLGPRALVMDIELSACYTF